MSDEAAADVPSLEPRRLTDPRDMRALAHPIRVALLELLAVHGPLTATQAGALIGESPSLCSFHLRTLARHGFVVPSGDGSGRRRPWRLVALGTSFSSAEADEETLQASNALHQMFFERQLDRLRGWWGRRAEAPPDWVDAASQNEYVVWLTPDELVEVTDAVHEILNRRKERLVDPALRPPGAELVEVLYVAYPFAAPGQGEESHAEQA